VANGAEAVPGFESSPVVATKYSAPNAAEQAMDRRTPSIFA
jgi:hypothetical protein